MNISVELIEKAKSAKTAEELITMAKALNIELTSEEATDYFAKLNQKFGKVSDEELDNVSGGACYIGDGSLIVSAVNVCELYRCYVCGTKYEIPHIFPCERFWLCGTCSYAETKGGYLICTNKVNAR